MIIIQQEERGYTVFLNDVSTEKPLSMLEFGFSRIREGVVVGPRIRRDYVMHFVLNGSGTFEGIPIHAGEGFLISPGKLHTFTVDPEQLWEHCWIAFSGKNAKSLLNDYRIETANHVFSFSNLEQFRRDIQRMRQTEAPTELTLSAFFYYMLSLRKDTILPSSPSGNLSREYVETAVSLIRSGYSDPMKITDLADKINISQKYLWKIFKRQLGISPQNYLLQVRMDAALQYLRSTNLTVSEVARSVGYPDAVSFIHNFKKHTGMTPSQYRYSAEKSSKA